MLATYADPFALADGRRAKDHLDPEGKAVVELKGSAKVVFPDLTGVEEA